MIYILSPIPKRTNILIRTLQLKIFRKNFFLFSSFICAERGMMLNFMQPTSSKNMLASSPFSAACRSSRMVEITRREVSALVSRNLNTSAAAGQREGWAWSPEVVVLCCSYERLTVKEKMMLIGYRLWRGRENIPKCFFSQFCFRKYTHIDQITTPLAIHQTLRPSRKLWAPKPFSILPSESNEYTKFSLNGRPNHGMSDFPCIFKKKKVVV